MHPTISAPPKRAGLAAQRRPSRSVNVRPGPHTPDGSGRGRPLARPGRSPLPYSAPHAGLSNSPEAHRAETPVAPPRRDRRLWIAVLLMLAGASQAGGAFTLIGLAVEDVATRQVVERYTLARQLKPVRFIGTLKTTDWVMDRPPFAATLARHLHPPLERYHISDKGNGTYTVDDMGALRGSIRLVARGPERRVYFVEGQFRSLAHLLKLTGSMVFTLEYRERWEGNEPYTEVDPQLFIRLDNLVAHGILRVLAPLIHGVIDRRVTGLTEATRIVSQRLTKDPRGLYRQMRTWPDVRPEDLEEYRRAFRTGEESAREGAKEEG